MNENKKKAWIASEAECVLLETKDIITSSIIEEDDYEGELDVLIF